MDYDSQRYWQNCQNRIFSIAFCAECGKYFHYPGSMCPNCLSEDVTLKQVSGEGTLYSYTLSRPTEEQPSRPMAWVALAEQSDVIVVAPLLGGIPPIDSPVAVEWIPNEFTSDSDWLPAFRAAGRRNAAEEQ